jgi:hypothetical protein
MKCLKNTCNVNTASPGGYCSRHKRQGGAGTAVQRGGGGRRGGGSDALSQEERKKQKQQARVKKRGLPGSYRALKDARKAKRKGIRHSPKR